MLGMELKFVDPKSQEFLNYVQDQQLARIYQRSDLERDFVDIDSEDNEPLQGLYSFETSDGEIFRLTAPETKLCKTLKDMIEDYDKVLVVDEIIPTQISNEHFVQLKNCLQFLTNDNEVDLKEYLIKSTPHEVVKLFEAADYVNCQKLYEASLIHLAEQLQILNGLDYQYAPQVLQKLDLNNVLLNNLSKRFMSGKNVKSILNHVEKISLKYQFQSINERIKYSPDGSKLALYSDYDRVRFAAGDYNTIFIFDIEERKCIARLTSGGGFVFSQDGTKGASNHGNLIQLWNVETGKRLLLLNGHTRSINAITFNPDDTILASGSRDHTVRIWDVKTGECLHTLEDHTNLIRQIIFSPDGTKLATCSWDKTIRLWDVRTGECLHTLEGHTDYVDLIIFNHDGTKLASSSLWSRDFTTRLWDVGTGRCLHTFEGHTKLVRSIAFNLDGTMLASCSVDKTIRLWNVGTGECLRTLEGHTSWVRSIVFNYDGTKLISYSDDKTIRFWDIETGSCLHTLKGFNFALCPHGISLAVALVQNNVQIWNLIDQDLKNILRNINAPDALLLAHIAEQYTTIKEPVSVESLLLNKLPPLIKERLLEKGIVKEIQEEESEKMESLYKHFRQGMHF